jgi:hypothetical protein
MLQKKPGKYIHGGCGAIINLPLNPKHLIPCQTECGLAFIYCEECQSRKISNDTKYQD